MSDVRAFSVAHAELVAELRAGISFRHFQPDAPIKNGVITIDTCSMLLDVFNTVINDRTPLNVDPYLQSMMRMSTLANGYLIGAIARRLNPATAYLNVGTFEGFTLFSGMAGNAEGHAIGVDNFSQFGGPREKFFQGYRRYRTPRSEFYNMDYVKYFRDYHKAPVGFYVYDGPHDYENQKNGLVLAEPFLTRDAIIMVDDTNGEVERQATMDFIGGRTDEYKVLLDERTYGNEHPTFWNGVMLIGRSG